MATTTITDPILLDSTGQRIAEALEKANEIAEFGEITSKFDGTAKTYHKIMREWFETRAQSSKTLTELCNEWYEITRTGWCGGVTFSQPDVTTVSTGTRFGDNAGLSCTPSTDTTANQDDYAGLPLFAVTTVNWELDENGKKVITAIKGIHNTFESHNPEKLVGVMQMTGYVAFVEHDTTYDAIYSDSQNVSYPVKPLPEAIEPDNTINNFVLHSKYMSGTYDGKMTCCAGLPPTRNMSYSTLVTRPHTVGDLYGGSSIVDWSFLVWMMMIKYASLTMDGIMNGCCSYNYQYTAALAEEGANRILLTTAPNLIVGSSILIGIKDGTSTDRGYAQIYSISGTDGRVITSIETITIDNTEYTAIYVEGDSFDTTTDTIISTWHWISGSCDSVQGNDGSPNNLTNGRNPAMMQGIEYMVGGYEVLSDVILYLDGENYTPYVVADETKKKNANNVSIESYGYNKVELYSIQPAADGWNYIRKLSYKDGIFFQTDTTGGSSATYTKDAFYKNAAGTIGYREWLAFGNLDHGAYAGVSYLVGGFALSLAIWGILARLTPNSSRGEVSA